MNIDIERLSNAKDIALDFHKRFNIGTYKERSEHLILKLFYEPDISFHEVKIGKYFADICKDNNIIEIQTANFANLTSKIEYFVNNGFEVKIVYPISEISRVCWCDTDTGDVSEGKYKTYKRSVFKILPELLHINDLINNDKVTIDIVFAKTSTYKLLDGYDVTKKKKATKNDTVIDEIIYIETIDSTEDIKNIFDIDYDKIYTVKDFESEFGLHRRKLWKAVKFLEVSNIIQNENDNLKKKMYKFVK